ncbi:MAG: hypothetical protein Q9166_001247 [cf. Caloplaca sp. 2 TL-2023]
MTNTTYLERDLHHLAPEQRTTANTRDVWLTISTCKQPISTTIGSTRPPPQLEVYISRSPDNKKPDNRRNDQVIDVKDGYGSVNVSSVTNDIWIGVRAPPKPTGFDGIYNYELAASIDAPYADYFEGDPTIKDTQITAWDTDSSSVLLWTGDITNALSNSTVFKEWMAKPPPFKVYVHNRADPAIQGIKRSVCGLRNYAEIKDSNNSMIKIGGQPKQQFYVEGLNRSSSYYAIMTLETQSSNLTIGGGGTVWKETSFTTKSDNNCQIVYGLPFCSDVAYAVPSNSTTNMTELGLTYDRWANNSYQNFDKSLQQIPCNTTPSARYSLARTCQDCDNAYKAWLCAVTIPRCDDFSASPSKAHLLPRNINQIFINGSDVPDEPKGYLFSKDNKSTNYFGISRNPMIDREIKPELSGSAAVCMST